MNVFRSLSSTTPLHDGRSLADGVLALLDGVVDVGIGVDRVLHLTLEEHEVRDEVLQK